MKLRLACFVVFLLAGLQAVEARSQLLDLQRSLAAEDPAELAKDALSLGDAKRGAIVFHQPYLACTKCHTAGEADKPLGPDLARLPKRPTAVHLIESVLLPSKVIRKPYQPVVVIDDDGKTVTGLLMEEDDDMLVLRDASQDGKRVTIQKKNIDERVNSPTSIMPATLVNQLASRQQFLDLVRYLIAVTEGGPAAALALKPDPALYAPRPLPEYETEIDHAGMIASLDRDSFRRGQAIYNRLCINCHGTHDRPGSLPTSLRFASGKFKSGSDPFTMYQTLTKGFGMMVPQMWMVPEQKYDVIHYIREAYLKQNNPSQYFALDQKYLDRLPKGTTRGPKPSNILPWEQMDYGPNLVATYEIGDDASNFAYKGNAVRLDAGPGGVSRGRHWMVFDYDTLRVAAAWSGKGFIDYNGINFNGRHAIHPRIVGDVQLANPTGPGWASPQGSFEDPRLRGRDDRIYGPLPRDWVHYKGMYYHGQQVVISYKVGTADVLELPGMQMVGGKPVVTRTLNIGPRQRDLVMQVARRGAEDELRVMEKGQVAVLGPLSGAVVSEDVGATPQAAVVFDGATRIEPARPDDFDLTDSDYTIFGRIKTRRGGTIFCKTADTPNWVHDGKSLFVRGGRLTFDIGWVGAVSSKTRVADGRWHDVAMTFDHQSGRVQLYIDGKTDGAGNLKPKASVEDHVVRIGYTSSDFPRRPSFFDGEIARVAFFRRALSSTEIEQLSGNKRPEKGLVAQWDISQARGASVADASSNGHDAAVVVGKPTTTSQPGAALAAGLAGDVAGAKWRADEGNLRLTIPAGDQPLRFTLWAVGVEKATEVETVVASLDDKSVARDLTQLTRGGPPRWPEKLKSTVTLGSEDGPFAVDTLIHPVNNPWFCRLRLTGFDFFPDGDRAAVCAWDGSVWLVSGLASLPETSEASKPPQLTWQRIASGLFQPLGLKIVDGRIYVSCRDQICILHDLNGDGEIDYFENFNNDHQVTDHFHEFAMGLQTDAEGNFYYAKSARHALAALVPHHGTLLRVSPDGQRTEILATGFRAANGVCINGDGTFIVTDQEGHWNPKNRINWVSPGGFYGNMYGYHDVTDSSDDAMQQPLCWITNAFDRSPAELLWVKSKKWGPLDGSLLNLSYGYGKAYVVPHEKIDGQMQGGMCALPLQLPTGIMRGRFRAQDGQLYTCGMFAWAGSQQQPGGFYRIRYTGKPAHLPVALNAKKRGMQLTFSDAVDRESAAEPSNYAVKIWSLKRTKSYGSKHYGEQTLKVSSAEVAEDGKSVLLTIPDIEPTWCMEIRYRIKGAGGRRAEGVIHNTIHKLAK